MLPGLKTDWPHSGAPGWVPGHLCLGSDPHSCAKAVDGCVPVPLLYCCCPRGPKCREGRGGGPLTGGHRKGKKHLTHGIWVLMSQTTVSLAVPEPRRPHQICCRTFVPKSRLWDSLPDDRRTLPEDDFPRETDIPPSVFIFTASPLVLNLTSPVLWPLSKEPKIRNLWNLSSLRQFLKPESALARRSRSPVLFCFQGY
jgi:hypothetical protein